MHWGLINYNSNKSLHFGLDLFVSQISPILICRWFDFFGNFPTSCVVLCFQALERCDTGLVAMCMLTVVQGMLRECMWMFRRMTNKREHWWGKHLAWNWGVGFELCSREPQQSQNADYLLLHSFRKPLCIMGDTFQAYIETLQNAGLLRAIGILVGGLVIHQRPEYPSVIISSSLFQGEPTCHRQSIIILTMVTSVCQSSVWQKTNKQTNVVKQMKNPIWL